MVTPRKVYTREKRAFLVRNALRLRRAFLRRPETVVCGIYYDPALRLGPLDKLADAGFVLARLHFQQLAFAAKCFGWPLRLEYAAFLAALRRVAAGEPRGAVFASLDASGALELAFAADVPQFTLAGLADQLKILTAEPDWIEGKYAVYTTQLAAIEVRIDPEPSVPCPASTFALRDTWVRDEAVERVLARYPEPFEDGDSDSDEDGDSSGGGGDSGTLAGAFSALDGDATLLDGLADVDLLPPDDDMGPDLAAVLEPEDDTPPRLALTYNGVQQVLNAGEFTVAFMRQGVWLTPHVATGCRLDPLRAALLRFGVLREAVFSVQQLAPFEDCLLVSATYGVLRGVVCGDKPEVLSRVGRKRKARTRPKEAQGISEAQAARRSQQAQRMAGEKIPGTGSFRI